MNTKLKSQTLYAQYLALDQRMNAPSITPERRAELRPLSDKLKAAYKIALSEEAELAVERLNTLRQHTLLTGFRTSRSQNEILATFSGAELADILRKVNR